MPAPALRRSRQQRLPGAGNRLSTPGRQGAREFLAHLPRRGIGSAASHLVKKPPAQIQGGKAPAVDTAGVQRDPSGSGELDVALRRVAENDGLTQAVVVTEESFANPEEVVRDLRRQRHSRSDPGMDEGPGAHYVREDQGLREKFGMVPGHSRAEFPGQITTPPGVHPVALEGRGASRAHENLSATATQSEEIEQHLLVITAQKNCGGKLAPDRQQSLDDPGRCFPPIDIIPEEDQFVPLAKFEGLEQHLKLGRAAVDVADAEQPSSLRGTQLRSPRRATSRNNALGAHSAYRGRALASPPPTREPSWPHTDIRSHLCLGPSTTATPFWSPSRLSARPEDTLYFAGDLLNGQRMRLPSRGCLTLPLAVLFCSLVLGACQDKNLPASSQPAADEWPTYGGSLAREFSRAKDANLSVDDARKLVPLWRFQTGAVVTASPIIAHVNMPSGDRERLLFIPSWDGHLYALRPEDGSLVWSYRFKTHPGASFPQAGSAAVADMGKETRVFVASGMTMYSFAAATGDVIWEFDAGTGCTDCNFLTERNEILSSPALFDGAVYFGMDVNDYGEGKGGFYAVDARDGTLRWYFDVVTGSACQPNPGDEIRRFDGYHSSAELGLPEDFFATRSGCDFDRTGVACGNVWSSAAIDPERGWLYTASSNCDTDFDPTTPDPEPPMPPYDEALFVLETATGKPVWKWRAYEVDNDDLAIGAVPNLFRVEIEGEEREVVGFGQKNGFYYLLDRDGVNEITGEIEPYWSTQVVPGGDIGGIIASAAVLDGKVFFSTAIGEDLSNPQRPAAFALDASTGALLWANPDSFASYAPTSAIPGVVFMGSIAGAVYVYDAETGEELNRLAVVGPASSPAVVVDGVVYVGAGTGARGGSPAGVAFQTSLIPSPVSAFCVAGRDGCPLEGSCDDGNSCTKDESEEGKCVNPPLPEGTACTIGAFGGDCRGGFCLIDEKLCGDDNQCTTDRATPAGCRYDLLPDGTPCVVRDDGGQCRNGRCEKVESPTQRPKDQ